MRFPWKSAIFLTVVVGGAVAAYKPIVDYLQERNRPKFRTDLTERGDITYVVNATGTVQPVLSVHIGSFVSGPIDKLYVDFNDEVEKDQLLAEIDPRLYKANVARDQAGLAISKANLMRTQARLQNAVNDEERALGLQKDNENFISQTELDQYKFSRMALEAELEVSKANIEQAQANLSNSTANLDYTEIRSTVDGIVIDKKIEPGQTLAAQFQTPELFIIAPDMRKEMHIFASVDEADIGLIREAQQAGQTVKFTIFAHPGELFEGEITQIRLSPTTTQTVVTYPVVVSTENKELKLLPGMTAEISFKIREQKDVIKVPNAALRYYPKREHVREEDRKILDGTEEKQASGEESGDSQPATVKAKGEEESRRRHVWVKEGDLLKAVEVTTGISDYQYTELTSGDLKESEEVVVGLKTK